MRILLINHYAGSIRHGMEYRPFYLAREWVRLGHDVTVIAASHSHVRLRAPQLANKWGTEEEIEGIRYLWLRTPGYEGNGVRRAVNILCFVGTLLRHARQLARDGRPDVVIASSTYPLDIVPAYCIAKAACARLVFEVHDLWPLSLIELGGMSRWHPFVMLLQWAENLAYRKADCVVSVLPKAAQHMQAHGMEPAKFAHVPNGINVDEWQGHVALAEEHSQALEALRGKGQFIIGYAGAHGVANALDSLLQAARLLQEKPVSIVLVGHGPEKARLQRLALEMRLTNVLFMPSVPRSSVPALLSAMDALYIGLRNESLFRFGVSPNKLMDYMMAARPVVNAIEAGNDIVLESQCGISIPSEKPSAIADAIVDLMRMTPAERAAMGLRGREYVLANHDYRVLARQFLEHVSNGRGEGH